MKNNKIMSKPIFKNRKNEEAELKDGRKAWLSRSTAVIIVMLAVYKGQIFVIAEKRSKTMTDGPGLWSVPSGYLDWDETGWEAAVRELYEETGFYIPKYKGHLIFNNGEEPWFIRTDPGENRQNVVLSFCLIYDFAEGLPEEVEKYKDPEIEKVEWLLFKDMMKTGKDWGV